MSKFLAIVKLTLKSSMRSHIFHLLLFFLLIGAVAIPAAVTAGDGLAADYIQLALFYSLQSVSWILALSSLWLGAAAMSRDLDGYQLHMTVSKPVSRWTVYLGKFTAVSVMHIGLLIFSAVLIYAGISYQYQKRNFGPSERQKVENEVMVGRRVFMPDRIDIEAVLNRILPEKIARLKKESPSFDDSPQNIERIKEEARKEIIVEFSRLPAGEPRPFVYSGMPRDLKTPLYLRFRPYIESVESGKQRPTYGLWQIGIPRVNQAAGPKNEFDRENEANKPAYNLYLYPLAGGIQTLQGGQFHELVLQPQWNMITPDRQIHLMYTNFDERNGTQFFQQEDGPKLLLKVTGFAGNYWRGICIAAMMLVMMAALGCAAAAVFYMPSAIFLIVSYLLFGSFAAYMTGDVFIGDNMDLIGYYVSKMLLWIIIPVQSFDISDLLAKGELVESARIGKVFLFNIVFRTLPWFLAGGIIYNRRELGLAVKK